LSLQLDTGSSILWMWSMLDNIDGESEAVQQQQQPWYNPKLSGDSQEWGPNEFDFSYAVKSIKFRLFYDRFHIGSLTAESQLFGAADYALYPGNDEGNAHGILGLSFGREVAPPEVLWHADEASKNSRSIPAHNNLIMDLAKSDAVAEPVVAFL